ncbi:NAD(P)H-binding protein [Dysgonomonas sp. HGC4]|uniref:NAD(P)H-binding protein n=1 Tax=Dysgonomonas sp. HGC4 TaxID=1658009 RepID=UPI00068121F7|nr:NAD(P)H-binding protein [Dysgonomonas sp. HGC4]MBD8347944.1 NAD(P)H-binding protein [Dysgonomonas sp. HGC4]
MNNNKTAILLGASGLVGSFLLDILLNSEEYSSVVIFVRKEISRKHPKLVEHVIDFDQLDKYANLVQGDDLFCCLGTTIKQAKTREAFKKVDYYYPLRFAEMAKQNRVQQYLMVTSIGANAGSSVFYLKTKGECEEAIKKVNLSSTSVFRPASLLGPRKELRAQEKIGEAVLKLVSFLLVGKLKKYKPVQAEKVAQAMYTIAQSPKEGFSIYESNQIQSL